jgi:hypothetical protein
MPSALKRFHGGRKSRVLVQGDDSRHGIAGEATEEALGRASILLGGEQKLDGPTGRVPSPVPIFFFTPYLYIGLLGCGSFCWSASDVAGNRLFSSGA